jgi:NADH dehydrogenase
VTDVQVVVSAVQGFAGPGRVSPKSVDWEGNANLIATATREGAQMVLISVVGAGPESPMELFRCKWQAEETLRGSGIPWTIVRATAFVELWADIMRKPIVFGRGDNPINFVSVTDVARAVCQSAIHSELRGQTIEIGGNENLTLNEFAALLLDVRGQRARVRHIPRPLLRALAPFHRLPRAALAMDTTDMTFAPGPGLEGVPTTPVRDALANHLNVGNPEKPAIRGPARQE